MTFSLDSDIVDHDFEEELKTEKLHSAVAVVMGIIKKKYKECQLQFAQWNS